MNRRERQGCRSFGMGERRYATEGLKASDPLGKPRGGGGRARMRSYSSLA